MNTTSILIKTDPPVKKEAQETAKKMGLSLNAVVTGLLKEFTRRKALTFEKLSCKKVDSFTDTQQ